MTMPAGVDVGATVREMWTTRPVRDADDRKIAGVAAALARRYAIDPTLVRVGFVVAGVYGVGVLLYLAGWLALPARPGARRASTGVVVAAGVVGVATFAGAVGGGPRVVIGLAVVAALLFALHRSRAALGVPGEGAAAAPTARGVDQVPPETDGPPRWDPLGAAPFAWDLPEPGESPAPRAPRSRVVPVTLAAALVAAGVVTALGLVGILPLGVTPVVGTVLAVIGIGLVVGAFTRAGRGLVVAAIPLALVLVAAAGDGPAAWSDDDGRWGPPWADGSRDGTSVAIDDGTWAPTSAAAVAPSYSTGIGDARLDLRALPPGGPPVTTSVESGVGDVEVQVGPTADATVECTTGAGDVVCLGRPGAGRIIDLGVDGPGGPAISLRASSGAGNVEVTRG